MPIAECQTEIQETESSIQKSEISNRKSRDRPDGAELLLHDLGFFVVKNLHSLLTVIRRCRRAHSEIGNHQSVFLFLFHLDSVEVGIARVEAVGEGVHRGCGG